VQEPAAEVPKPAPVKTLAVGQGGSLTVSALLQAWLTGAHQGDAITSTFRVRRAEIRLKGEVVPKSLSFVVMFDPAKVLESKDVKLTVANQEPAPADPKKPETVTAKQPPGAISVFQDVLMTWLTPYADVSIGQFKNPVSWEGFNSSRQLLFAERSLVSREYGDRRDLGMQAMKTFDSFGYVLGVYNGTGLNALDGDTNKDVALRLEVYPVKGLTLAGVGYGTLGDRDRPGSKDRHEIDVRYEGGPLLVQAEAIRAREVAGPGKDTVSMGDYGAVAWSVGAWQPCVRVGWLDPDTSKDLKPADDKGKDEVVSYEVGVNWYLAKHEAKLQLNLGHFAYDDKPPVQTATFAAQLSF
jgi:hypothetical protein